jgi:hypothetical protein
MCSRHLEQEGRLDSEVSSEDAAYPSALPASAFLETDREAIRSTSPFSLATTFKRFSFLD